MAESSVRNDGYARAPDLLKGYVASAVGYHSVGVPAEIHRGLPSPYLTFVFSLADPIVTGHSLGHARGPMAHRTKIILAGLGPKPTYIVPNENQIGLQLAVHPLAARALFGLPASELNGRVVEAGEVLGAPVGRLRDRMVEAAEWSQRFALLHDYLRKRLDRASGGRVRPEVAEAWRRLARQGGNGALTAVAEQVALSPRQLRTLFEREVGMSPKQVGRLIRFDHVKRRIARAAARGGPLDLAAIAADGGYCDQAHLDRDFGVYVDVSPSRWLAEERRNIQAGGHRVGEESDA